MKGQLITIALVVAVGVACFVALDGTYDSLQLARSTYYERARFGDVFAHLERAPEAVVADLEAIDGVSRVESRVVESAMIPLKTMAVPARAILVSLPNHGAPMLNGLYLRKGRSIEPGRADEIVLLDAFAEAHEMEPGAVLPAVINGRLRELRVVGIAMSPEYVMTMAAGELAPDPKRIAVIWMARDALSAAFQMEGAFNDVTLELQPGADVRSVVTRVDQRLAPFGGLGAVGRDKQPSNFMIEGELVQLESMSTSLPVMFLAVAALLLNLVLSRLVHLQRPEIASLEALGYRDSEVGLHFLKLVLLISGLGAAIGLGLGAWLGVAMIDLYREYFKFPQALAQALLTKRTAAADLESTRFAALVADHELQMARATLSRTAGGGEPLDIPAPVGGRVLRVIQQSEGVVQAGTPLIELGDPAALEIVVDVLTSDAVDVRPAAKVSVDRWGGAPLAAHVRMIEPSAFTRLSALGVEEQRVNVLIDLDGPRDEWAALGDGYRVEAKIVVWESNDVLAIPASAAFRHDKKWAAYRVVAGRAALTPIEISHRNALSVEVTAGIDLPASLIVQPSDRLRDGLQVVAR